MKILKMIGPAGIVALIAVALYYALRPNSNNPPIQNTAPAYTPGAAAVYQIGHNVPAPSPDLLFESPPIPPTPDYQRFNYSPSESLANSPLGANSADAGFRTPRPGSCGCQDCSPGTYGDGQSDTTLAATQAKQAASMGQQQVDTLSAKISSMGQVGGFNFSGAGGVFSAV